MIHHNSSIPGDIKSFKVKIEDNDITPAVSGILVFLDVLMPSWTCQVLLDDTNNLIMNLPIKQGNKLKITIETQLSSSMDGKKEFEFVLFQISDRIFLNYNYQRYVIHGVSKAWLKNTGKRVSQFFDNKSPVDIAKQILTENLEGNLKSHNANNTISTIISNLSPYTAIAQMCRVAMIDKRADFIFFQSDNEEYKMHSIEKIYTDEESDITFKMYPANIRKDGNLKEDYCLCFHLFKFKHYNSIFNAGAGYYANKITRLDLTTLNWSEKKFKFGDDCSADSKAKTWEDSELFEKEDSNIAFIPKHPKMTDSGETILDSAEDWATSRKSSLLKLEQDNLIIQAPCGIKGWESLGKTCKVDLPSGQDHVDDKYDKQYKGKYIISAICFSINQNIAVANYHLIKKRPEKS